MGLEGAALAAAYVGVAAAVASGASSAYSSKASATASKKATAAQERIARQEIEAAKESERLASETAKNKLKMKQASQTKTILSQPMGLDDNVGTTNATTLGV